MGSGASRLPPSTAEGATLDGLVSEIGGDKSVNDVVKEVRATSKKPELLMAARLLDASEGCSELASAVRSLADEATFPKELESYISRKFLKQRRLAPVVPQAAPVLKGLMMKCDEFDGIHALKTDRPHPEVWNFRKTKGEVPIYGTGQCHLKGLAYIAAKLKADGYDKVFWFNMREEPLVYLNGTGCAPRTEGKLNENVDYLLSIQGYELDAMEARLVQDCLEASKGSEGGAGMKLWYEVNMVNEQRDMAVEPELSFGVHGAYQWVNQQAGAAQVSYVRVPIADETAPEEQDFDQLVDELKEVVTAEAKAALVFNCHMGRGRTTTGMVLELLGQIDAACGVSGLGLKCKLLVDQCANDCDEVTNLMTAPAKCIEKAENAAAASAAAWIAPTAGLAEDAEGAAFWMHRGVKYLERYAYLLLFAAYVQTTAAEGYPLYFSDWMRNHWAFVRILKELRLD